MDDEPLVVPPRRAARARSKSLGRRRSRSGSWSRTQSTTALWNRRNATCSWATIRFSSLRRRRSGGPWCRGPSRDRSRRASVAGRDRGRRRSAGPGVVARLSRGHVPPCGGRRRRARRSGRAVAVDRVEVQRRLAAVAQVAVTTLGGERREVGRVMSLIASLLSVFAVSRGRRTGPSRCRPAGSSSCPVACGSPPGGGRPRSSPCRGPSSRGDRRRRGRRVVGRWCVGNSRGELVEQVVERRLEHDVVFGDGLVRAAGQRGVHRDDLRPEGGVVRADRAGRDHCDPWWTLRTTRPAAPDGADMKTPWSVEHGEQQAGCPTGTEGTSRRADTARSRYQGRDRPGIPRRAPVG